MAIANRWTAVCALLLLPALMAASKQSHKAQVGTPGEFDYYLLAMSWAPGFCAQGTPNRTDLECGKGRHVGFVVHGLWPQRNDGVWIENCSPASPVPGNIIDQMLPIMPSAGLIQHEWRKHGTCSGLAVANYFGAIRKAFTSVRIPKEFKAPAGSSAVNPVDIESAFATANPSAGRAAFTVGCASNELQEIRVCLTKDLNPRPCPANAKECHASRILVRPVY